MGLEYQIRFPADHDQLESKIRKLPYFADYDAPHDLYYLRSDRTMTGMPDAWVSINPDGLYFCDNGGSSEGRALIFRSVIDLALEVATKIEIEQL